MCSTTPPSAPITPTGQASLTDTTLTWNVPTLAPDGTVTLSYTVIVNEGAYGVTLRNVATPDDSGECEQPDDCTTTHPTPRWTLTKLSDPESGATVNPGDTVAYTLTATQRLRWRRHRRHGNRRPVRRPRQRNFRHDHPGRRGHPQRYNADLDVAESVQSRGRRDPHLHGDRE